MPGRSLSLKKGFLMIGIVARWDDERGYGFLKPDDNTRDYFVHHTAISMTGHRTLYVGQAVEFEIGENERGLHAVRVLPLDGPAAAGG
jgi:CspA family cold shock protein